MESLQLPSHGLADFAKHLRHSSLCRDFTKQMIVGTASAGIWITASYPFDTIKTRLQLAGTAPASTRGVKRNSYGVVTAAINMMRGEGVFSMWRGLAFPLATQALKGSFGWFSYNTFNNYLFDNKREDYKNYSYLKAGLAGSLAGLCVSGIVIPTEVLKIRMQGTNASMQNAKGTRYQNNLALMSSLVRNEGVGALFKGSTATFCRLTIAWFFYYEVQEALEDLMKRTRDPCVAPTGEQTFIAGGLAGVISWAFSMPFDTLKTRMQMYPERYTGFGDCVKQSARNHGLSGFYGGFNAVLCRAFVANALAFWSYRKCSKLYDEWNTDM